MGLLENWNRTYFDERLSPGVLEHLAQVEGQSEEVSAFTERLFDRMKRAGLTASDFSELLGWWLGVMVPRLLPGSWGGIIPPITVGGRHEVIDRYIQGNTWTELPDRGTFLDMGCGFPPTTAADTALVFENWQVVGADPSIPDHIVYDALGDYASFDEHGELLYFQSATADFDHWDQLLHDPDATKKHFRELRDRLVSNESHSEGGARMERDPVRQHTRGNLSLRQGGIGDIDIGNVDVARCFNVFLYYDLAFREQALEWFASILKPGGLFLCGTNQARSMECRYTVYRNEEQGLSAKEFAFSLDNVRLQTIVPFYALHDDEHDTEMLVRMIRTIRSNDEFMRDFDAHVDRLLTENELFRRDENGYLTYLAEEMPSKEREQRLFDVGNQLDHDGYVEGAAQALTAAGLKAWRNPVGHIGVAPESIDHS